MRFPTRTSAGVPDKRFDQIFRLRQIVYRLGHKRLEQIQPAPGRSASPLMPFRNMLVNPAQTANFDKLLFFMVLLEIAWDFSLNKLGIEVEAA